MCSANTARDMRVFNKSLCNYVTRIAILKISSEKSVAYIFFFVINLDI